MSPAAGVALALPARTGPPPRTTGDAPHQQVDQQPTDLVPLERLARRLFALPDVTERPSGISVPGARALCLTAGPSTSDAFLVDREFAHLHPAPDHSLHVILPTACAEHAVLQGWAEWHPAVLRGDLPRTIVMVFAPRDDEEATVVEAIIRASWQFARGDLAPTC